MEPILVVMAAGMGSRYGGLKQLDPVGANGEIIIDYAIYDAYRAGFKKVVFIIKKEHLADFKEAIGDKISNKIQVEYAFQDINDIPEGFEVPTDRVKPWGTSHAVMSARNIIKGPFAVINSDDYYGPEAFKKIYDYLSSTPDSSVYEFAMVGYKLQNTLTENGSVSRGACVVNENGYLDSVTELTKIIKDTPNPKYSLDGETWQEISGETPVSLNLWGFTESFVKEAISGFPSFLEKTIKENPLKGEYLLPSVVSQLISSGKAKVKVLESHDKWYGVTYKEDKPTVVNAIKALTEQGLYPKNLWE